MENIIVKSLEELGILLKGIIEIIKKRRKQAKRGISPNAITEISC